MIDIFRIFLFLILFSLHLWNSNTPQGFNWAVPGRILLVAAHLVYGPLGRHDPKLVY